MISATMSLTRRALSTTSAMVLPASPTSCVPASTLATESPMSCLISLAACALRCARLRTSPATTAKPRPWSPARAASTAALSARMLVWKAMPSMTPMMSLILLLDWLISPMVATTWPTTSPPCWATWAALLASWLAWRADSLVWRTVAVSSSMLLAVSSRLAAACSVRWDRSVEPRATSLLELPISSDALRTVIRVLRRPAAMVLSARSTRSGSLLPSTVSSIVRSPAAIFSTASTARPALRTSPLVMNRPSTTSSAMAPTPSTVTVTLALRSTRRMRARSAWEARSSEAMSAKMSLTSRSSNGWPSALICCTAASVSPRSSHCTTRCTTGLSSFSVACTRASSAVASLLPPTGISRNCCSVFSMPAWALSYATRCCWRLVSVLASAMFSVATPRMLM